MSSDCAAAADVGGERLSDCPALRVGRRSRSDVSALAHVRLEPVKAETGWKVLHFCTVQGV